MYCIVRLPVCTFGFAQDREAVADGFDSVYVPAPMLYARNMSNNMPTGPVRVRLPHIVGGLGEHPAEIAGMDDQRI